VQQLGAKQRIMELMGDNDPQVRYEALLAIQKFMVTNWYANTLLSLSGAN